MLCSHLSPGDVAQLTCVTSRGTLGQERMAIWRAYFVLNWGSEHGASDGTEVRIMRSWVDDPFPAPWPLAVGFCGARSSLDHLFWFLPFIRCILRIERPRCAPPPALPLALTWQVVCRVRTRLSGAERMAHCFLCDMLEVAPPGRPPQHFRQRWVRPCADCPMRAHRSCLERKLQGICRGECTSASSSTKGSVGKLPALRCRNCGQNYRISRRFPETLLELVNATMLEWRWVGRRNFIMLLFYFWLHSLAEHYAMLEGIGREFLMLMTACMMSISVSQRFHRAVQIIWHTPDRWHYLKLFALFAVLTYLTSLRTFEPSMWEPAARRMPWLKVLHEAHSVLYDSLLGTMALAMISWLYVATVSGVIFCFWKTSMRVPTVADEGDLQGDPLKHSSRCGLCQLGLCLDNTGM